MWDLKVLSKAPSVWPAPGFEAEGVRALFFEGPQWRGKPTRAFAYVGVPDVAPETTVPGIVLVHGGGGTAFVDWVRLWNRRGYAAIALDTCGSTPGGEHMKRPRHEHGGPPGWGGVSQIDEPREDQWSYHAVANIILAHSLLRSLPGVDPDRIGITGISWGGYLTCLAMSVDPRFRFAAPVYGCGFTTEHNLGGPVTALGPERAARWMRWWDPSSYMAHARLPVLWLTGSNDFAFTLNALQKSYRLPVGPRALCVRLNMPHGQEPGATPEEIAVFADSHVRGAAPLPRIAGQGREGAEVWAVFTSKAPVVRAELNVTRETGPWTKRTWETLPATVADDRVTAKLPDDARVYFLNLLDDRGCVVSTEHEEL